MRPSTPSRKQIPLLPDPTAAAVIAEKALTELADRFVRLRIRRLDGFVNLVMLLRRACTAMVPDAAEVGPVWVHAQLALLRALGDDVITHGATVDVVELLRRAAALSRDIPESMGGRR
jgi:hypothetical protein